MTTTQTLLNEHRDLRAKIEALREVADCIDLASAVSVDQELAEAFTFVKDYLAPHAEAEERVLYPAINELLGSTKATATMSRDHVEMRHYANRIDAMRLDIAYLNELLPAQKKELRRLLYGLYAIINLHLAKEEEIYFPLIAAHLDQAEAQDLLDALDAVTDEVRTKAAERVGGVA